MAAPASGGGVTWLSVFAALCGCVVAFYGGHFVYERGLRRGRSEGFAVGYRSAEQHQEARVRANQEAAHRHAYWLLSANVVQHRTWN